MVAKANNTKSNILVIDGNLCLSTMAGNAEEANDNKVVNIRILYDGNGECLHGVITLSNKKVNDDTVCAIAFGLYVLVFSLKYMMVAFFVFRKFSYMKILVC